MGTLGHRIHGVMEGEGTKHVRFKSHMGTCRIGSGVKLLLWNETKINRIGDIEKRRITMYGRHMWYLRALEWRQVWPTILGSRTIFEAKRS